MVYNVSVIYLEEMMVMLYRLYEFAHSVGIHFWDIPSILVLLIIAVIGVVHTICQKQREEDFQDKSEERARRVARERSVR